jgi:hypothetical protein
MTEKAKPRVLFRVLEFGNGFLLARLERLPRTRNKEGTIR